MDSRREIEVEATVPPPPGSSPRPDEQQRPLRRPTDDRVLFGVASGIGRSIGVDPVAVRVAFVLLAVFGGSGLLLYLIGLVAIPEASADDPVGTQAQAGGGRGAAIAIGVALIVLGGMNLVGQLVPGLRDLLGPVLVLTAGVLLIVWSGRR